MNVGWRIESGIEGVLQVGEIKVVLTNTEFKGKCQTCGKYGYKQNKCPERKRSKEEKGNKKFMGMCNHWGIVGHKAVSCWTLEANKDKRAKNQKEKEEKEVGALNWEVLLGCIEASAIEWKNSKVLFKIHLRELALQKFEEILIPSNPSNDNKTIQAISIWKKTKKIVKRVELWLNAA